MYLNFKNLHIYLTSVHLAGRFENLDEPELTRGL